MASARCSGSQGEADTSSGLPGKKVATSTVAAASSASARRTVSCGYMRLSMP